MTKPVRLPRHRALRVAEIDGKGRGVVAAAAIKAGEILEIAPVIPLKAGEAPPRGSILYDYPFRWNDPPYVEAIALGVLSVCNHSTAPNCDIDIFIDRKLVQLNAIRDIAVGEELTFDYGVPPWWEQAS
jgi:SET domain-containing protein